MSHEDMEVHCCRFDDQDMPLCVGVNGTYGTLRDLMGPEALSLAMYDDPELIHDIAETYRLELREKETVNDGNEDQIEPEITSKVPPLLAKGGYFPNGDHGLQPMVTFPALFPPVMM